VSRAQKAVVIVGLVVFVLMGLFPPRVYRFQDGWYPGGYVFIGTGAFEMVEPAPQLSPGWEAPRLAGSYGGGLWTSERIDTTRLTVQWVTLAVVVGTLLVLLQRRRPLPSAAP
jgi:hypothetical protein